MMQAANLGFLSIGRTANLFGVLSRATLVRGSTTLLPSQLKECQR